MTNIERKAGGIPTDFTKFSDSQLKKVKATLDKGQGAFLLKQTLIKNHKDTFGSNYMDQVKCGYKDETTLTIGHGAYDEGYLIETNRMFVTILHDTVYPRGSNLTKTTTNLQSLLDDPLVKKVLQDTPLGDEERWQEEVCLIPAVSILTRLCFPMEGMTELVNGTFIEDLNTLLSSCAEGKNRKTFFEIDKEFENMMDVVKSNFVTVDSCLLSMWVSLRQNLIHKLAYVKSTDQSAWIKTEDHRTDLLNDDQILTIENTDQSIKKYEAYSVRVIDTNTTVLLTGASNDDNPDMVASEPSSLR